LDKERTLEILLNQKEIAIKRKGNGPQNNEQDGRIEGVKQPDKERVSEDAAPGSGFNIFPATKFGDEDRQKCQKYQESETPGIYSGD
jgi:hypothetical protein